MDLVFPDNRVLVDTGPIVAMLSAADEHHEACVEQFRDIRGSAFNLLACHHGGRVAFAGLACGRSEAVVVLWRPPLRTRAAH